MQILLVCVDNKNFNIYIVVNEHTLL